MTQSEFTAAAAEVQALFGRMAESSAAALESLGQGDADAAVLAIEERQALTQQVEALLPELLSARSSDSDGVEDVLAAVRRAAESVQTADVELTLQINRQRENISEQLEAMDERTNVHSAYAPEPSARRAQINVLR